MSNLKIGDYIIPDLKINGIKKDSVGLIKNILGDVITIFFIGANISVKTDNKHIIYLDIHKTGKPYDKKICNVCHVLKDMREFDINQTDAKGRKTTRPSCKICRIEIDGEPLKITEKRRLSSITPKDIFTCPICKKTSIVDVTANLVKDHNHDTGMAREWICDSCNTGLGRFKDDIKLLEKAIDYLKKYQ